MLKTLTIYFYFMDFYITFQIERIKPGVTELILFQEGQIYPHPHMFRS